MLFNSLEFLIFFPTIVIAFFLLPHRFRWALLLAASYYFYMAWRPEYAILLALATLIDYVAALLMQRAGKSPVRAWLLYASLASNLGILFTFKYFNFFSESFSALMAGAGISYQIPLLDLLLPVGISFYTFKSLSYIIDVYKGVREPERHLGIFALYVSFFPQLIAGPIEQSTRFLPQLRAPVHFDPQRSASGLRLMLWGFFLKLVIADNAGVIVNTVYADPSRFGGLELMIATFFFALQIFTDFAGYSSIAIGAARILGYDLMQNFARPYFAQSIGEFWKRWHMSLMEWFKTYVYIPLGGNRVHALKWARNILIVFLISGLWHGARWTFVVWGLLNAAYLIVGKHTRDMRERVAQYVHLDRLPRVRVALQMVTTFLLTLFAWIFFRAATLSEALFVIRRIVQDIPVSVGRLTNAAALKDMLASLGLGKTQSIGLCIALVIMLGVHIIEEQRSVPELLSRTSSWVRWLLYYALILFIIFFAFLGEEAFIYFRF